MWKIYFRIKSSLCGKQDNNFVYNEQEKKEFSALFPKEHFIYEHIESYLYTSLRRREVMRNGSAQVKRRAFDHTRQGFESSARVRFRKKQTNRNNKF
jgi:hypothetical protein